MWPIHDKSLEKRQTSFEIGTSYERCHCNNKRNYSTSNYKITLTMHDTQICSAHPQFCFEVELVITSYIRRRFRGWAPGAHSLFALICNTKMIDWRPQVRSYIYTVGSPRFNIFWISACIYSKLKKMKYNLLNT